MKKSTLLYFLSFLFFAYSSAQTSIDSLQNIRKNASELTAQIAIHKKIADYYIFTKLNADSSQKYIRKIYERAGVEEDSLLFAEAYEKEAFRYYAMALYDSSLVYSDKAIRIFEANNKPYRVGMLQRKKGNTYQVLFQNRNAIRSFKEAEKVLKGEDLIVVNIGYGATYAQLNDLEKAIKYNDIAFKMANEFGRTEYLYNIHNCMTMVYNKNKDTDKAFSSLRLALDAAVEHKNYLGQVICHHNLGTMYNANEDYSQAATEFEKGLEILKSTPNALTEGAISYKYAESLLNLNRLAESNQMLDKADEIYKLREITGRLPSVMNVRAAIAKKEGKYSEAITILKKALSMSEENEIKGVIQDNYEDLSELYQLTGQYDLALDTYKKAGVIADSINKREKLRDIESLKVQFEVSQYEQELQNNEKLIAANKKSALYRNVLFGLAVLGLLFFIYRQRKINQAKRKTLEQEKEISILKQAQLESTVKFKTNEVTGYALQIDQRNSFLEDTKKQIKQIHRMASEKNLRDKLNELHYFIKENIEVNKDNVAFDTQVTAAGDTFQFNLEQQYPGLTEKEIKVCKYLVLDLSSKSIAEKMNISFQSVNNYRASIRKKMNLERGEKIKRVLNRL